MSSPSFYTLECIVCGKEHTEEQSCTHCTGCGNALNVRYDYDILRSRLNVHALRTTPITSTKYMRFYPIEDLSLLISMNEGGTPLVRCKNLQTQLGLERLYVKNEGANPTGVFKDRGSLVEVSKARELGAAAVCCASTGNMAASVSGYCAIAKMPCYVLVPEGTPIGKLAQSLMYGARVIQVRGTYADCCKLCEYMAKEHNFYLAGDYAFRAEGHKSCAFEIIEQLMWRSPDVVIAPVGCGTNLASIWKGFQEFHELGFIDRLPRMIGVQPENVPTIVDAFHKGNDRFTLVEKPSSVASAVAIGEPLDDIKVLRALRDSNGYAEVASESAILQAEKDMAHQESLFVEPSSALPIAVLPTLLKKGIVKPDETIVCIATGTGLKDPMSATAIMPDPPVLDPNTAEVDYYLEHKLYEIRGSMPQEKQQVLWEKKPTEDEIEAAIKDELNLSLAASHCQEIVREVGLFYEKKDGMRRADLQHIVESVLKEITDNEHALTVLDYRVTATQHGKPEAEVEISYLGETLQAQANGVGPVDAIIQAINEALNSQKTLDFGLSSYSVQIDTTGADAVVEVRMGITSGATKIVASASSPDIIVASIEAFTKGFNRLHRDTHTTS